MKARRWLTRTSVLTLGLALATLAQVSACSSAADEDLGVVRIAITQVPADVACLRITAVGSRTVSRTFAVSPGASSILLMTGLPTGQVQFTGDAFAETCPNVGPASVPNWSSDPVVAQVSTNPIATVTLIMRRNGRVSVRVDFQDDQTCLPVGASCSVDANCCSGRCTDPDADGVLTCEAPPACGAAGAPCTIGADCCSGRCTDPDADGVLTCEAPTACGVMGAPCTVDADCCARRCTDPDGDGLLTCG